MKVPYPVPATYAKLPTVEFPDRHVSYVIVSGVSNAVLEQCVAEVQKAVNLQHRGSEPDQLVINFASFL